MSEQGDFKDTLRRNRRTFLAILLLPVIGMVVAIPLIIIRLPGNFRLPIGLIVAFLCQYLVVVYLIMRRIDRVLASE